MNFSLSIGNVTKLPLQLPYAHDITSTGKADEPPQHINTIFVEFCDDADDNVAENKDEDEDEDED